MNKRMWLLISVLLVVAFVASACGTAGGTEVIYHPQALAGNPTSPSAQATAAAQPPRGTILADEIGCHGGDYETVDDFDGSMSGQVGKDVVFHICKQYAGQIDVFEVAGVSKAEAVTMLGAMGIALATPGPQDDLVVAIADLGYVAGKYVIRVVVVAGLFKLADLAIKWIQRNIFWSTAAAATTAATWTLENELAKNVWFSTDHAESARIIGALLAIAGINNFLKANCDENHLSSGSICIYGGVQGKKAHVAILWFIGRHVDFFVISANLITEPGPGLIKLGEGAYLNPSFLQWGCAWILSRTPGREAKDASEWMTAGEGWARWAEIKTQYSLVVPLVSIQLPKSPF